MPGFTNTPQITVEQKRFVQEHYKTMTVKEMSDHLNTSYIIIYNHMRRNGMVAIERRSNKPAASGRQYFFNIDKYNPATI